MNKNLVTSLELSKRLEKLGVKQESEFYWLSLQSGAIVELVSKFVKNQYKQGKFREGNIRYVSKKDMENGRRYYENDYSAFLSGELGETLPKINVHLPYKNELDYGKRWNLLIFETRERVWRVEYVWRGHNHQEIYYNEEAKTLAEAMGKMLVYLIENKLIEVR